MLPDLWNELGTYLLHQKLLREEYTRFAFSLGFSVCSLLLGALWYGTLTIHFRRHQIFTTYFYL